MHVFLLLIYRLEKEHSQFLSFENGAGADGPDAFVEEETNILEKIKHQHDVIEMERKVRFSREKYLSYVR